MWQIVLDVLTEYFLNNVQRVGKSDYKPTQKDIEMIKQHYPENVTIQFADAIFKFSNCELKPSKLSIFYKIDCIIFMIDLTSYHRVTVNPNTNCQSNEMQLTLDNLKRIYKIRYCLAYIANCLECEPVRVLGCLECEPIGSRSRQL